MNEKIKFYRVLIFIILLITATISIYGGLNSRTQNLDHYDYEVAKKYSLDEEKIARRPYLDYIISSNEDRAWVINSGDLERWEYGRRMIRYENVGFLEDQEAELYQKYVVYHMIDDKFLLEGYGEKIQAINLETGEHNIIIDDAIDIIEKDGDFQFIRQDHNVWKIDEENFNDIYKIRDNVVAFEQEQALTENDEGANKSEDWYLRYGKACHTFTKGTSKEYDIPMAKGYEILATQKVFEDDYVDSEGYYIEDKATQDVLIFSVYNNDATRDVYALFADINSSKFELKQLTQKVMDAKARSEYDRTYLYYFSKNNTVYRQVIVCDKIEKARPITTEAVGIKKVPISGVGIIFPKEIIDDRMLREYAAGFDYIYFYDI